MLLNLLQLTLSLPLNHRLSSIIFFFAFFLHFSLPTPIPPPLSAPSPSLLPSFYPFLSLSPRPLLSPGGMRRARRLAVCAAVMAWAPELRILWWCWGLFTQFVGPYTTVTQQQQQQHAHADIHIQAHSGEITALIFPTQDFFFWTFHITLHFDVGSVVVIKILSC